MTNFDLVEIGTATMILFAVVDIFGSIPVIIDLKQKTGNIQEFKATMVSMSIMLAFLFLGESILKVIGIDINSFAVAGALVMFCIGLEMVLGINLFKEDATSHKTVSIVPLAFPLIAGAGSMTTIISLRAEYEQINIMIAIIINCLVVYSVLRLIKQIERILGEGGIAVLKKVFGIIILAVSVKLFSSNIKALFEHL